MPYRVIKTTIGKHVRHAVTTDDVKQSVRACDKQPVDGKDVSEALSVHVSCRKCKEWLRERGLV